MKDTACENCPFKKMGFETCPNYIETIWHEQGDPQPRIVKDCAPKRTLLMVQELYNRCLGMQCQISQQEGVINQAREEVNQLFNALKIIEEHKRLEAEAKRKVIQHLSSITGSTNDNPVHAISHSPQ